MSNELSAPASSLWVRPAMETRQLLHYPPQFLEHLHVERPGFRPVPRCHADGHAEGRMFCWAAPSTTSVAAFICLAGSSFVPEKRLCPPGQRQHRHRRLRVQSVSHRAEGAACVSVAAEPNGAWAYGRHEYGIDSTTAGFLSPLSTHLIPRSRRRIKMWKLLCLLSCAAVAAQVSGAILLPLCLARACMLVLRAFRSLFLNMTGSLNPSPPATRFWPSTISGGG